MSVSDNRYRTVFPVELAGPFMCEGYRRYRRRTRKFTRAPDTPQHDGRIFYGSGAILDWPHSVSMCHLCVVAAKQTVARRAVLQA